MHTCMNKILRGYCKNFHLIFKYELSTSDLNPSERCVFEKKFFLEVGRGGWMLLQEGEIKVHRMLSGSSLFCFFLNQNKAVCLLKCWVRLKSVT